MEGEKAFRDTEVYNNVLEVSFSLLAIFDSRLGFMAHLPSAYDQLLFYLTALAFLKVNCIWFDFLSDPSLFIKRRLEQIFGISFFPLNGSDLFDVCRHHFSAKPYLSCETEQGLHTGTSSGMQSAVLLNHLQ